MTGPECAGYSVVKRVTRQIVELDLEQVVLGFKLNQ